jgi:APA family basic amino acid/polyamine antiporter
MALNAVYLTVLPIGTVIRSERIAADAADAILGSGGGAILAELVLVSTLGALTGIVLAGPRVYLAMARDGLLFRWAGAVHPRFRTPHVALALQGLCAALLAVTGTYRALFSRVIYTEWIFFGLLAVGIYRLRARRPAEDPAASLPRQEGGGGSGQQGPPAAGRGALRLPAWVPAAFALAAFAVAANQLLARPRDALLGLGFVLLGVPVYGLWVRRRREAPP